MSYFGVFMNKLCANRCVAFRTADQSDATFALSSVQKRTFHCVLLSLSFFRSVLVSRISSQLSRTHSLSSAHPSRPAPSALLCSILVTLTRTYCAVYVQRTLYVHAHIIIQYLLCHRHCHSWKCDCHLQYRVQSRALFCLSTIYQSNQLIRSFSKLLICYS